MTQFSTLEEEVSFWHSALGHPDAEIMANIFSSPISTMLNPISIRNFFPKSCPDYPIGNLQFRQLYLFLCYMTIRLRPLKLILNENRRMPLANRLRLFKVSFTLSLVFTCTITHEAL
jgi:hypothetical protein